jgi:DNA uptake protein ComE-like DNA-binding protein
VIAGRPRHSCLGGYSAALVLTVAFVTFEARTAMAADPDLDLKAVQVVCGRCHTTAVFLKQSRSWNRWNDVFEDMTKRGANGTEEQLARVTTYFMENLTIVNVNSSPSDELAGVLGVGEDVVQAIIAQRQRQPFANIAQLRAVVGVDPGKLAQRKRRIFF